MMHKFNHTPYDKKQIIELAISSLTTNIMSRISCMSIEPQNGPTPYEPTSQKFHVVLNKALTLTCPFAHTCRKELPSHLNQLALCTI